jgi:hypothetical protein
LRVNHSKKKHPLKLYRSHLSGSNHQQALLSLAKFYFSFEAYPTAMDVRQFNILLQSFLAVFELTCYFQALEEATRLARLAGDRAIIDQCTW